MSSQHAPYESHDLLQKAPFNIATPKGTRLKCDRAFTISEDQAMAAENGCNKTAKAQVFGVTPLPSEHLSLRGTEDDQNTTASR